MAPRNGFLNTVKLTGKTAIVTGCNTGIGKETVLDFYKRGARVIMACRNIEKAEEARADVEIKCRNINNTGIIVVEKLDLMSLKSVREFAQKILATEPQVNILVNNAGVMMCPKGETEDGFETQFGTNHLGHFLLSLLLLPRIRNSTPARIVTVSSMAHESNDLFLDDLNYKKRKYKPMEAYSQSKIANVLFSKELSLKLKEHNIEGINTYSLHPGIIKTDLMRHLKLPWGTRPIIELAFRPFSKTIEQGAHTQIYCAIAEKCANETGLYYSDCAVKTPSRKALNDELAKKLWDASVQLVGLDHNPFTLLDPGIRAN